MKKILFFVIIFIATKSGKCQLLSIGCNKVEVSPSQLFVGVPNEMHVTCTGLTDKLTVSVDTGELKYIDRKYYLTPLKKGKVTVTLKCEIAKQTSMETFSFEAIELPNPILLLVRANNDTMKIRNKMSLQQLRDIVKVDIAYNFKQAYIEGQLKTFTLVGVKTNGQLKSITSNNEKLKQDLSLLLALLSKGDYFIIKDMELEIASIKRIETVKNVCVEIE